MKQSNYPVALTIAGSDSGGGAGIQADLKTFASLRVHGTCVITCLTAQNPKGVLGIQAARPAFVRQQLEAVFDALPPRAVKTGMLFSTPIIQTVADFFKKRPHPRLIVDPVMVATSGARLLKTPAITALCRDLLPMAVVVTPNLPEAEILSGLAIRSIEDLRAAARAIQKRYGCAALVKGGHLEDLDTAVDIFYDGRQERLLGAPRIRAVSTHGTGCTFSAAIAGYYARGGPLAEAIARAKEYITQAIARSVRVHHYTVLNHEVIDGLEMYP